MSLLQAEAFLHSKTSRLPANRARRRQRSADSFPTCLVFQQMTSALVLAGRSLVSQERSRAACITSGWVPNL